MKGTGRTDRIKDRIARARYLVEAGKVERCGDLHVVAGNGGNYTIDLGGESCTCPAGRKGMQCYHVAAVEIFEARERACRRTRKPRTDRRGDSLKGIIADLGRIDALAAKLAV